MKKLVIPSLLVVFALFITTGCEQQNLQPSSLKDSKSQKPDDKPKIFTAHLSAEAPGVISTATGQAIFKVSKDGESIHYKLIVANINDVLMAHIHLRPENSQNGPIVVWLYPSAPPASLIPGRSDGILAEGDFTADNFVGPLAGMSFSDLLNGIQSGLTYVNVHTTTYPGGEIRGTLK